ncbi:hypothetical protein O181_047028 [Austropuccinia psidii MF-1]|uniref:Uncharacterized protein n=1 Tax=Austropuccinia psidii MF-1 TaxID=1389203 RepID=A0A9Q3DV89_9BASI|nr:hypothetical protein [Austropuccinia psidii MF-1]
MEGRGSRRSNPFSVVVGRFPRTSRTSFRGPVQDGEEEEENSVEEEESDGTEGIPAPVGASQGTGGPNLAQSHQSELSVLAIMQQMTRIMANLQADSSSDSSRPPAFKRPSMKEPDALMGLSPSKLEALFSLVNLFSIMSRKTSLKTERRAFMPLHFSLEGLQNVFSLIFPSSPIKIQIIFSSLGNYLNPNSSPYLDTQMKSLVSEIWAWGERALIHHFRKGFPSSILDQLASHTSIIDSLQDLMDVALELDTRYHERQTEKSHHQERKPEASKFFKLRSKEGEEFSEEGQAPFFFVE